MSILLLTLAPKFPKSGTTVSDPICGILTFIPCRVVLFCCAVLWFFSRTSTCEGKRKESFLTQIYVCMKRQSKSAGHPTRMGLWTATSYCWSLLTLPKCANFEMFSRLWHFMFFALESVKTLNLKFSPVIKLPFPDRQFHPFTQSFWLQVEYNST